MSVDESRCNPECLNVCPVYRALLADTNEIMNNPEFSDDQRRNYLQQTEPNFRRIMYLADGCEGPSGDYPVDICRSAEAYNESMVFGHEETDVTTEYSISTSALKNIARVFLFAGAVAMVLRKSR